MAARRTFRFFYRSSRVCSLPVSKVSNISQAQRHITSKASFSSFSKYFSRSLGQFLPRNSGYVTEGVLEVSRAMAALSFYHRLSQCNVRSYSTSEGYQQLKDQVKIILSKAPTQDQAKMDKQFALLELLCQHKEGYFTSADVTEASKQLTGDHLYELALVVYSLKHKVGEETVEFWAPLFRLAALTGNIDAKYMYAQMLRSGTGIDPDLLEAAKLFGDLSDQGHPYAQFALAGMCYHGIGVDQDFKSAFDLYELSSKNGVDMALSMLGNMYMNGHAVEQNSKLALQYFQMGVNKGDPSAELCLAYCYSHGKGVSEDLMKAFEYHLSAAKKGHPVALYNVGTQYFAGKGVQADLKKAAEYFKKAADLGFDLAQINLGNMYYNGLGVEKDWGKAKNLYRQAAMANKNAEALLKEVEEDERKLNETKPEE